MLIFPAIDLFDGKAVRLYRGDYRQMTVYSDDPVSVSLDFTRIGASHIHLVDLEGAKSGTTPNFEVVEKIKKASGAFCEIGGGIRSMETIDRYIDAGLDRVILGTAAVLNGELVDKAVEKYGDKIAVGADIRDGMVAISGWMEKSSLSSDEFAEKMQKSGVKTLISTDISRDGAMQGTNRALYRELSEKYSMRIVASGGISSLDDVYALADMGLYGAIIGRAYYTGDINLAEALSVERQI